MDSCLRDGCCSMVCAYLAGWTCKRVADNALTQLDFIIGGLQFEHEKSRHDKCWALKIGSYLWTMKVRHRVSNRLYGNYCEQNANPTLPALERMLLTAGRELGQCKTMRFTFRPSRRLRGLCSMRRSTADVVMRKMLSFEIRKLHRQEFRFWKNSRLTQSLGRVSHWKAT